MVSLPPKNCHFSPSSIFFKKHFSKEFKQNALDLIRVLLRGGGLGSRPKKMYGERLGDGVEYHLMKPTPRR